MPKDCEKRFALRSVDRLEAMHATGVHDNPSIHRSCRTRNNLTTIVVTLQHVSLLVVSLEVTTLATILRV